MDPIDIDSVGRVSRFRSEANMEPFVLSEDNNYKKNINTTEYEPTEGDNQSMIDKSLRHQDTTYEIEIPALPVRQNFEAHLTPYRWPLTFFFCFNITAISCMSLSMSPQSDLLRYAYGIGVQEVNMCSTIFSATYIPMTFTSMWLYSKIPSGMVIRIGCLLFITGCWFRSISASNGAFWPILVGQAWMSLAYPLFNGAMNLIPNRWFPDSQRTLITAVCGLSIPMGNIFAFTMSGLIFAHLNKNSTQQQIKDAESLLILIQNCWITCVTVPLFFLIRDKPSKPPSLVAMQKPKQSEFLPNFKEAIKVKNFVILLIAFFCVDGGFIAFGSVLGSIFANTTLSTGMVSLVCGLTVIFGLIASFTSGALIQRHKKFKLMMQLSCFGCLILMTIAIFTFAAYTDGVMISINVMVMGFAIVPIIPIGINFSSELTFPIDPPVITGTLLMTGQLGGLILAILAGFICDTGRMGSSHAWILFAFLAATGSVCSVMIEEDLRKTNFNSRKTQQDLNRLSAIQNFDQTEASESKTEYAEDE